MLQHDCVGVLPVVILHNHVRALLVVLRHEHVGVVLLRHDRIGVSPYVAGLTHGRARAPPGSYANENNVNTSTGRRRGGISSPYLYTTARPPSLRTDESRARDDEEL